MSKEKVKEIIIASPDRPTVALLETLIKLIAEDQIKVTQALSIAEVQQALESNGAEERDVLLFLSERVADGQIPELLQYANSLIESGVEVVPHSMNEYSEFSQHFKKSNENFMMMTPKRKVVALVQGLLAK